MGVAKQRGVAPSEVMGITCGWCAFSLDDALAGREYVAQVIGAVRARQAAEEVRADAEQKRADDHYQATGRVRF